MYPKIRISKIPRKYKIVKVKGRYEVIELVKESKL